MQGSSAPSGPRILGLVDCPLIDFTVGAGSKSVHSRALVQVLDIHSVLAAALPGGFAHTPTMLNGLEALEAVATLER
jgi:hypothetical protein